MGPVDQTASDLDADLQLPDAMGAPTAPGRGTRSAAGALLGALLAAAAGFVAIDRLDDPQPIVASVRLAVDGAPGSAAFSPNGDGRRDRIGIAAGVHGSGKVRLTVVDAAGDAVRTFADGDGRATWDGRDDDGRPVPDGRYRVRVGLRDDGRSELAPGAIVKDTRPPAPRVVAIGPQRAPVPELLPERDGGPAVVHFGSPAGEGAQVRVFRTAPGTPAQVLAAPLDRGATTWRWDGRDADGQRVGPGTYLVAPAWRDAAGNAGSAVPLDGRGLPVLGRGRLPGRGGVTVRYLAVQAPVLPANAGAPVQLGVDARRSPYRWSVRRLGDDRRAVGSHRPKTKPIVTFQAPSERRSGVYLFSARTGAHAATVPFAVQGRAAVAGTAAQPHGVLVVLPTITWAGRDAVDDDGDGAPNTLDLGAPARLSRVAAGDGLPVGFGAHEAPVLRWLDQTDRRFDVTTDAALALGRGPRPATHRGVLLAGDARWLPAGVRTSLRAFVRRGGTLVSLGTDSLRRTVQLDARGQLVRPSPAAPIDLFGSRLGPVQRRTTDLEVFQDDDRVELFKGAEGLFRHVTAWEPTEQAGDEAGIVSRAVTQRPAGRDVVVALELGDGLVVRPGFPDFGRRLSASTDDPAVSALMARMWTLLSR